MANLIPKKAEPITASEIRAYAEQLDAFLQVMRKAEAQALKEPGQALNIFGISSGKAGIDRLRTMVQQLDRSRYQASIGAPIQTGQKQNQRRQATDPE